jgi:hypothetical protein
VLCFKAGWVWDDVETIAIKFRLKAKAIDGVVGGRCDALKRGYPKLI